jgi:putative redox protein
VEPCAFDVTAGHGRALAVLRKNGSFEVNPQTNFAQTDTEKVYAHETGAGRFQVEIHAGGATFFADEPVALGGLGTGPTPYDLLSAALAACTLMTVRLYSARKNWNVRSVVVGVGHSRGSLSTRDRFDREIVIDGDLDDEMRLRLIDIANRCPFHSTLERGADVNTVLSDRAPEDTSTARHGLHMKHMVESCAEARPTA